MAISWGKNGVGKLSKNGTDKPKIVTEYARQPASNQEAIQKKEVGLA